MKNIAFYKIVICFGLLWLTYSCEKAADQTTTSKVVPNGQLSNRDEVGACDQCPANDCCCGIELINTNFSKNLRLCGTDDGTASCTGNSAPSPCSNISGGGQSKLLSVSDPKLLFCMVKGNTMTVTNTHPSLPAIVTLTCHYGETGPQTVLDTIPPTATHYYLIQNSCDAVECVP